MKKNFQTRFLIIFDYNDKEILKQVFKNCIYKDTFFGTDINSKFINKIIQHNFLIHSTTFFFDGQIKERTLDFYLKRKKFYYKKHKLSEIIENIKTHDISKIININNLSKWKENINTNFIFIYEIKINNILTI